MLRQSPGSIGLMTVAIWTVHRKNGFFIIKEGWEYVFLVAVVALFVATSGPAKYSLDHALDIDDNLAGTFGFWLALLLGLGVTSALVGAAMRRDASWTRSAREYLQLYRAVARGR